MSLERLVSEPESATLCPKSGRSESLMSTRTIIPKTVVLENSARAFDMVAGIMSQELFVSKPGSMKSDAKCIYVCVDIRAPSPSPNRLFGLGVFLSEFVAGPHPIPSIVSGKSTHIKGV